MCILCTHIQYCMYIHTKKFYTIMIVCNLILNFISQPSSSGRSAQLLETSSFVGFPTLAEGGALSLPVFTGLSLVNLDEGEGQTINPQLQVILKKMNKKDAITRLKVCTLHMKKYLQSVQTSIKFLHSIRTNS